MPATDRARVAQEKLAALIDEAERRRKKLLQKTIFQPNDSLVHVHVGSTTEIMCKPEVFTVHKNLLCDRSDYFKAALTGIFKEAREGKITLDDEDPDTFRRFWSWLYTCNFYKGLESCAYWTWASDLYVFAEKRFIPDLQNAVMDALLHTSRKWLGSVSPETEIPRVWPMVSEGSPLRAYLVDCFLDKELGEDLVNLYPVSFIVAIAVRAQQLKRQTPKEIEKELAESRCQRYHANHQSMDQPCQEMTKALFGFNAHLSTLIRGKIGNRRDITPNAAD